MVSAALLALLNAAEASVALLERGRVRRLFEAERRGAEALMSISEAPRKLLASTALARSVAYSSTAVTVSWVLGEMYPDLHGLGHAAWGAIIAVVMLFVFGEALPRTVAIQNPERVALASAGSARHLTGILYPAAQTLSLLWTWGMSLAADRRGPGAPWITEDEYSAGFSASDEMATDAEREALIESVEQFTERIVREVMVPRTDIVSLEDTATVGEALAVIGQAGYSRLPVFHESLDDIRGVLYAKDLLLELGRGAEHEMRVERFVRPAHFVPETKSVRELLLHMKRRSHIAMVADEYGGTAGLVTIEDLLEEIVGDIFDEYDRRMPVAELNEVFGTVVDREADSVGGLFIEEIGHIPDVGEYVDIEGLTITVDELDGNRILQLVVETPGGTVSEEGQDEGDNSV